MRISVNLASKPFVEVRPLLAKLRVAIAFLVVVAVALAVWLHALRGKAAAALAEIDAVRVQTTQLQQQRQVSEARMRQPANQAVLARSRFLNGVFARKSFSWTAVMMDLERVLPSGVQVTSIEPQVATDGTVTIRLRVSGDRDRTVLLVRNLETSRRFVKPRLAGEAAQATEGAGQVRAVGLQSVGAPQPGTVEFEILSGYNPLQETHSQTRGSASASANSGISRPSSATRQSQTGDR